jgi:ATP-dependent Clp protease ATP-binding subunit ClpC
LNQGYNKEYGARPLRRVIQNLLEDRIAEALLQGIIARDTVVVANAENESLAITVEASSNSLASISASGDGNAAA